jgi:hypothetical protein
MAARDKEISKQVGKAGKVTAGDVKVIMAPRMGKEVQKEPSTHSQTVAVVGVGVVVVVVSGTATTTTIMIIIMPTTVKAAARAVVERAAEAGRARGRVEKAAAAARAGREREGTAAMGTYSLVANLSSCAWLSHEPLNLNSY